MHIVPLTNHTSLNDVAKKVYSLKSKDKRIAQASNALAAANPYLLGDLRKLPTGTPIAVPVLPGLDIPPAHPIDPRRNALMTLLQQIGASVQQASAAQLTGMTAATADATEAQPPQRTAAIQMLRADIAAFIKWHG